MSEYENNPELQAAEAEAREQTSRDYVSQVEPTLEEDEFFFDEPEGTLESNDRYAVSPKVASILVIFIVIALVIYFVAY